MLLDRDGPGDRERALTLLDQASQLYRRLGMPRHRQMTEAVATTN